MQFYFLHICKDFLVPSIITIFCMFVQIIKWLKWFYVYLDTFSFGTNLHKSFKAKKKKYVPLILKKFTNFHCLIDEGVFSCTILMYSTLKIMYSIGTYLLRTVCLSDIIDHLGIFFFLILPKHVQLKLTNP